MAGTGCRRFEITPELPDGFQEFGVGSLPEVSPVQVGTQFPNGSRLAAQPAFREQLRPVAQGIE